MLRKYSPDPGVELGVFFDPLSPFPLLCGLAQRVQLVDQEVRSSLRYIFVELGGKEPAVRVNVCHDPSADGLLPARVQFHGEVFYVHPLPVLRRDRDLVQHCHQVLWLYRVGFHCYASAVQESIPTTAQNHRLPLEEEEADRLSNDSRLLGP